MKISKFFLQDASGPSGRAGFTLIEVLMAFAILSIILGAVYSTFFLSHKAMEGLDESLVKLQECRGMMDTLSREGDAIFYSAANKNSIFKVEDRDLYGKQTSRLIFTAFSPLIPGLSTISYYVEEMDGKPMVLKKIHSAYRSGENQEGAEMIEGVEAFTVEARDKDKWVKTWDASEIKKIPEEIRVTITVLIKDRQVSLHETIKPKIGKTL
jgi:general secretion pathway protein J